MNASSFFAFIFVSSILLSSLHEHLFLTEVVAIISLRITSFHLQCISSENERSQTAFVTFKDPEGAEMAVLLSVTLLNNLPIHLSLLPYILFA